MPSDFENFEFAPFEYDAPRWKDFTLEKYQRKKRMVVSFLQKRHQRKAPTLPGYFYDSLDSEEENVDWFLTEHSGHFLAEPIEEAAITSDEDSPVMAEECDSTLQVEKLHTKSNSKQQALIDFVINNNCVGNRLQRRNFLDEDDSMPKLNASDLFAYLQSVDDFSIQSDEEETREETVPPVLAKRNVLLEKLCSPTRDSSLVSRSISSFSRKRSLVSGPPVGILLPTAHLVVEKENFENRKPYLNNKTPPPSGDRKVHALKKEPVAFEKVSSLLSQFNVRLRPGKK